MELDFNIEELIDLSFLTEEEQDVIVQVLYRDNELRLLEEQRIKKLQQSIHDPEQLKIATGDWFKEARARRHADKRYGSDIIRASIRKKKKTKGEREKRVTINDEKIIINEQSDQDEEEHENENFIVTNEESVNPELVNTGVGETNCEQSEINNRSIDDKSYVTSNEGTFTLETNTQIQQDSNEASVKKVAVDNDSLGTEEDNQLVPVITLENYDPIDDVDGDDVSSQHNKEANLPTEGLDVNCSVSSLPSAMDASSSMSSFLPPTLSGSMMSLYTNTDVGCVDVRGSITFSLHYNDSKSEFHINVVQCNDLAGAKKNSSNPYVKSYLLPDKSFQGKRKTSVKKKTLNPTFNEQLLYKLEKAELQSRTLNLSVWHRDHFGHNPFLGEVEITLEHWDWTNTKPTTYTLQPRIAAPPSMNQSKGQLSLSLKFIPAGSCDQGLPSTAEVHIWLKEARNLIPIRSKGINSFIKCCILPDTNKSSQQKTRVIKKDLNPVYNHTMVYDGFQTEDVSETCAEFTIWDHDTFSSQLLGGLRLSLGTGFSYGQPVNWMDSNKEEISVWQRMLAVPGQWVDTVLPIRSNVIPSE
ncbi:synaptotagmin-like protein 1 [Pristis pectinata]|uniref:synaptotagmin-like protein 1 n=1 Tax=Pristis pectinata TaxID=685728 RepID=UPI00223E57C2|nr:synaptotagmin-like protein 1 [Pristis pectinata]